MDQRIVKPLRQLTVGSALAVMALAGTHCESSSAPRQPVVFGIQYSSPVSPAAIAQLSSVRSVIAVVRCGQTALVLTTAAYSDLAGLPEVAAVGPGLGSSDTTLVEALVTFVAPVQTADSLAMARIGQVLGILDFRVIGILAPARQLARLDSVPGSASCFVVIDPLRPQNRLGRDAPN